MISLVYEEAAKSAFGRENYFSKLKLQAGL